MDTVERLEGGSIDVPKGQPTWYSCSWLWRQEAPSLQHLRGQSPSAAEAWAAGGGWEQSVAGKGHRGSQGGVAEGNTDVDPNDALGRVCVCTPCVGAFYVILVNSLYYSYFHRNKNVATGDGREIQEGGDIHSSMANSY